MYCRTHLFSLQRSAGCTVAVPYLRIMITAYMHVEILALSVAWLSKQNSTANQVVAMLVPPACGKVFFTHTCKRGLQIPHPVDLLALRPKEHFRQLAWCVRVDRSCATAHLSTSKFSTARLRQPVSLAPLQTPFGTMSRDFPGKSPVPMTFEHPAVQSFFPTTVENTTCVAHCNCR